MKKVNGVWLPDDEAHLELMLSRATAIDGFAGYQQDKLRTSMHYAPDRGCAVDVGANVGLWTRWLAELFGQVHAYEPLPQNIECMKLNLPAAIARKVQLHARAVGPHTGMAKITYGEHGPVDATVREGGGQYPIGPLDPELPRVDYLKIDTAGYELNALLGCRAIIERDHPTVVIDVKWRKDIAEIEGTMAKMGAAMVKDMSGCLVFQWETR